MLQERSPVSDEIRAQARDALGGLGWRPTIARAAVEDAWSHVGPTSRSSR